MTHRQCIAILLEAAPGDKRAAEEHVSRCSDCWAVLSLLHELTAGTPPPDAGRMSALYGCTPVQDSLYLLAGMTAAQMRAAHPDLTRHLGWCLACRDRLAEVVAVEQAAARGELGAPLFTPATERLRRTAARVHEAVGRMVVHVRRAAAAFTAVPEGFAVVPMPALAGASRAAQPAGPDAGPPPLGHQVRFRLPDSPVSAELRLESRGDDRVGLALRFEGDPLTGLSVQLREIGTGRDDLVARHTVRGGKPIVVEGLRAGHYLLEILERPQARRFQVRFDVEPAG